MRLHLTDFSEEPLQLQIVRQLSEKILNGELDNDTSLPSIRVLAHQAKVSVITVQRAYETLENLGLINARRGKGFYVANIKHDERKQLAIENFKNKMIPAVQSAIKEGLSTEDIIDTFNSIIKSNTSK